MSKRECYHGANGCKYWSHDMDSSYCSHPLSYAETGFGRSTNNFMREGRPCGPDMKLWEPIDDNRS